MRCGIPSVPTKRSVLETSCDTVLVALQATFADSILLVLRACFGSTVSNDFGETWYGCAKITRVLPNRTGLVEYINRMAVHSCAGICGVARTKPPPPAPPSPSL